MTSNVAELERQVMEMAAIAAIATMAPEERALKLAEYAERVAQLDAEKQKLLDQARQQIDAGATPDLAIARRLSRFARVHRSAQIALERLQKAITQAERQEGKNTTMTAKKQQSKPMSSAELLNSTLQKNADAYNAPVTPEQRKQGAAAAYIPGQQAPITSARKGRGKA